MVADHLGHAATIGADAGLDPERARTRSATARTTALEQAGDVAAGLYSNQEALGPLRGGAGPGRRARRRLRAPRRPRPDRREAGRRRPAPGPRGPRGRAVGGVPRVPPRPGGPGAGGRPAPQDRRRPLEQGRPRGLDRPLPARHRPAEGRPALPGAGPPLRGGRLALHAHRRQHAGDLRVGEGSAPGRAARASRRRRAAPTASSAVSSAGSATPSARARTSSARSSWRASPTPPRRSGRCWRWATTSRSPRPTTRRRPTPTARALQTAERIGDLPSQVELHASLSTARAPPRRVGRGRVRDRDGRGAGRARGPDRQALLPAPAARARCAGATATSRAPSARCGAPPSWPSRSGARRSASRRCIGWRPRCATAASTPMPTRRWRPRSTPASGPAWSPSRWRRQRPARSTRRSGAARSRPSGSPRRRAGWPSGCAIRSAAPRRWRRGGSPPATPAVAGRGARGLAGARPPGRRRARRAPERVDRPA